MLRLRVVLALLLSSSALTAQEFAFRLEVISPAVTLSTNGEGATVATLRVPAGAESVPVEVAVILDLAIDACVSNAAGCDGGESFFDAGTGVYGCVDGEDNDGDGLVDFEDPDCRGAAGWSLSLAIDDSFGTSGATTDGTIADLSSNPPGMRDDEGNFESTELVDPAENAGQLGVVSAVILSFMHPIFVAPESSSTVLRVMGELDVSGLAVGEETAPCVLRLVPREEEGLTGSASPVTTLVSVLGESFTPEVESIVIVAEVIEGGVQLLRGDCNDDGQVNISDPVCTLNWLFAGGAMPECIAATNVNGDDAVNISDPTFLLNHLFAGGPAPVPPFPECGSADLLVDEELGCVVPTTSCNQG